MINEIHPLQDHKGQYFVRTCMYIHEVYISAEGYVY